VATKTPTRKKLDRPAVLARIDEILSAGAPDAEALLAFAEFINGKPFPEPVLTLTELKTAVCNVFGCKNATELRKSSEFNLAMAGRTFDLKTKADWLKLYREWVGVPHSERTKTGKTSINGIDVLQQNPSDHVMPSHFRRQQEFSASVLKSSKVSVSSLMPMMMTIGSSLKENSLSTNQVKPAADVFTKKA
jgi:hypothetical protein